MKITHVRVRRLQSGPGFEHRAVEAEAAVADHETPESVRAELDLWVTAQLSDRGVAGLREEASQLRWTIDQLGRQNAALLSERDTLKAEVARLGGLQAQLKAVEQETGQTDLETAIGASNVDRARRLGKRNIRKPTK